MMYVRLGSVVCLRICGAFYVVVCSSHSRFLDCHSEGLMIVTMSPFFPQFGRRGMVHFVWANSVVVTVLWYGSGWPGVFVESRPLLVDHVVCAALVNSVLV